MDFIFSILSFPSQRRISLGFSLRTVRIIIVSPAYFFSSYFLFTWHNNTKSSKISIKEITMSPLSSKIVYPIISYGLLQIPILFWKPKLQSRISIDSKTPPKLSFSFPLPPDPHQLLSKYFCPLMPLFAKMSQ